MTLRAMILCSTLLLSTPLFAQGKNDLIVMKNGDRFTGEIKALGGGVLSVDLPYVDGTISMQWSQVAQLQSNACSWYIRKAAPYIPGRFRRQEHPTILQSKSNSQTRKARKWQGRKWKSHSARSSN